MVSNSLPVLVTCFHLRASFPSNRSVREATVKIAAPNRNLGRRIISDTGVSNTTTRNGTKKIRDKVSVFGRFIPVPPYENKFPLAILNSQKIFHHKRKF